MQPLKIPPWMSLILAAVFNTLAMLSLASIFTPGSKAAVAVMIINAVLFNVLALLGVPIVGGKAVVNSVTVTTTQDPAPLPPPPSGPHSLRLLPFLLIGAGLLSACAPTVKVSYQTMAAAAAWTSIAAKELPDACKGVEHQAIQSSKTEADATAAVDDIDKRCRVAASGLQAAYQSLIYGRDRVQTIAKASATPADLAQWMALAMDLYYKLQPVLAPLGVKLPGGI